MEIHNYIAGLRYTNPTYQAVSCGYEETAFTFNNSAPGVTGDKRLLYPFADYDNNIDVEWIIIDACSSFKGTTSDPKREVIKWAEALLPQPASGTSYKNPIHGIIGFRGLAPLNGERKIKKDFEKFTREGRSIIEAWAQATVNNPIIAQFPKGLMSSHNVGFIVRSENEGDGLPPLGTMTADSDDPDYKYYYIEYDYVKDPISRKYKITAPKKDEPFNFSNLKPGMPPVY